MLLAIDCGNTNATFGLFEGDKLRHHWRLSTQHSRTTDEYGVWLMGLFNHYGILPESIQHIIIANVVPPTDRPLRQMCQNFLNRAPSVVGDPALKLGIDILTQTPHEAGADRVVNVIAAYKRIGQAGAVIDFGTATTFDVLDDRGNYRGGIIAPGVNLSLKALVDAAAQLRPVPVRRPEKVIGETTRQAMESGVYWGYVSLIEGLITRVKHEMGGRPKILATGGLAPLFSEAIAGIDEVVENLTLEGLLEIAQRNGYKA